MPIYEYRCQNCDKVFEKIERSFEEHTEPCPACGGESQRIISNTSFVLKGTGWYVTDYCNRNGGADSAASGGNGKNGASAEAAPAEAKPASGSETPAPTAPSCSSGGCASTCAASTAK